MRLWSQLGAGFLRGGGLGLAGMGDVGETGATEDDAQDWELRAWER